MLEQFQVLERVTLPGDRREYVRLPEGALEDGMARKMNGLGVFRLLTERGLDLLAEAPATRRQRLQDLHDFYAFLEREMPSLFERWRVEKLSRQTGT